MHFSFKSSSILVLAHQHSLSITLSWKQKLVTGCFHDLSAGQSKTFSGLIERCYENRGRNALLSLELLKQTGWKPAAAVVYIFFFERKPI